MNQIYPENNFFGVANVSRKSSDVFKCRKIGSLTQKKSLNFYGQNSGFKFCEKIWTKSYCVHVFFDLHLFGFSLVQYFHFVYFWQRLHSPDK